MRIFIIMTTNQIDFNQLLIDSIERKLSKPIKVSSRVQKIVGTINEQQIYATFNLKPEVKSELIALIQNNIYRYNTNYDLSYLDIDWKLRLELNITNHPQLTCYIDSNPTRTCQNVFLFLFMILTIIFIPLYYYWCDYNKQTIKYQLHVDQIDNLIYNPTKLKHYEPSLETLEPLDGL